MTWADAGGRAFGARAPSPLCATFQQVLHRHILRVRRQALLKNFGGLREVARAGVEDLARVPGISPQLAQKIYDAFHGEE